MNKQFVWTFKDEKDYLKTIGSYREDAKLVTVKQIRKMLRNAAKRYKKNNFVHEFTDKNLINLENFANKELIKYNTRGKDECPYEKK
tara:strand:- start:1452 stop:1712 length:261 start_codon:yes stop_codon:yes gene_type:complete